jgi:hypothetical protein
VISQKTMEDVMSLKNRISDAKREARPALVALESGTWGWLLVAVLAVSCTPQTGDAPSTSGGANNVTPATPSGSTTTPAPSRTRAGHVPNNKVVPIPGNAAGENPLAEMPAALPRPAILEAVQTTHSKLEPLTASVQGTRVRFVDCSQTSSCTTRLEAQSLTGLRDLLQAVSQNEGGISFVAREQLDAYTGHTFVADVTLGGTQTRPVPTDENELLVPNGS